MMPFVYIVTKISICDDMHFFRCGLSTHIMSIGIHNPILVDDESDRLETVVWIDRGGGIPILSTKDRDIVLAGEKLNDQLMDHCQALLKQQFPGVSGLVSVLPRSKEVEKLADHFVFVCHPPNHWNCCSTLPSSLEGAPAGTGIALFDTLFMPNVVEPYIWARVRKIMGRDSCDIGVVDIPEQGDAVSCGYLTVANLFEILDGSTAGEMSTTRYIEKELASHLQKCLMDGEIRAFPRHPERPKPKEIVKNVLDAPRIYDRNK